MSKAKQNQMIYAKVVYVNDDGKEEPLEFYSMKVSEDPTAAAVEILYWEEEFIKQHIKFVYDTKGPKTS
jgi:hypothetical protein